MSESSKTLLLDRILIPQGLKNLSADQLKQLANELRTETVDAVAKTGGHLGAGTRRRRIDRRTSLRV